ncbi:AAA family ATPase [Furfurilactobacillus siliginis]|nr:ATP-binding protein [Furfurilactobacillus siliginis]GEK28132.1 abortive infection protein [Furfurilactobacillus siliginis]
MLIEFSATNYASIKNKITLSAETGAHLSRLRKTNTLEENNVSLLKSLLIFGPNGSGKSNLLDGLSLMKNLVLRNLPTVVEQLNGLPFMLNVENRNRPISFEVKFNYLEHTYSYAIEFYQNEIFSEKLSVFEKEKENIYFLRGKEVEEIIPESLADTRRATKSNTLLLFNAQAVNDSVSTEVFKWFAEDLIFVNETQPSSELVKLIQNPEIKKELLNFLKFADFNITDVNAINVKIPEAPEQIKKILEAIGSDAKFPAEGLQLYTSHKVYDDSGEVVRTENFPLNMESKGTQKIFLIALSIINAQISGNGKTLLFDEFDDSLHFELSKALVKLFNSETNLNQFILTTHELQLLDQNLRTDQIYLMDKDFQGESNLKSIFDFKDSRDSARYDVGFMKKYIAGRFGAVPQIDEEKMLAAIRIKGED